MKTIPKEKQVFYIGLCATCWQTFGRTADAVPTEDLCPICRDSVLLFFTPDRPLNPYLRRVLEVQERRMRDVHAALQYVLSERGPKYLRRLRGESAGSAGTTVFPFIARWDTSIIEFWQAVGLLLHDELTARVTSVTETEEIQA